MKLPGHSIAELAQRAVGSGFRGKGIRRRINDVLSGMRALAFKIGERGGLCREHSENNVGNNEWLCVRPREVKKKCRQVGVSLSGVSKLPGYDQVRICHSVFVFSHHPTLYAMELVSSLCLCFII